MEHTDETRAMVIKVNLFNELLEALQAFVDYHSTDYDDIPEMEQALAVIKKVKGEGQS